MAVARHPPQWYLVEEVLVILSLEVVRSIGATAQALAISQLLDVAQTSGDATITVGIVTIEGYADLAVAAGVDLTLVKDRLNLGIHDLGSLTAVGVEEVAASIGFIIGTVDIAVSEGKMQVARNLAAPLGNGVLLGLLDSRLDGIDGLGVLLIDDGGHAVFRFAAIHCGRFPAVQIRKTARYDNFSRVSIHNLFLLKIRRSG